jgi:hypothetical protein
MLPANCGRSRPAGSEHPDLQYPIAARHSHFDADRPTLAALADTVKLEEVQVDVQFDG